MSSCRFGRPQWQLSAPTQTPAQTPHLDRVDGQRQQGMPLGCTASWANRRPTPMFAMNGAKQMGGRSSELKAWHANRTSKSSNSHGKTASDTGTGKRTDPAANSIQSTFHSEHACLKHPSKRKQAQTRTSRMECQPGCDVWAVLFNARVAVGMSRQDTNTSHRDVHGLGAQHRIQ